LCTREEEEEKECDQKEWKEREKEGNEEVLIRDFDIPRL
jgi:hypothetical protein